MCTPIVKLDILCPRGHALIDKNAAEYKVYIVTSFHKSALVTNFLFFSSDETSINRRLDGSNREQYWQNQRPSTKLQHFQLSEGVPIGAPKLAGSSNGFSVRAPLRGHLSYICSGTKSYVLAPFWNRRTKCSADI